MIPERYAPMTYALFRIVFGFLFFMFRYAEDVRAGSAGRPRR